MRAFPAFLFQQAHETIALRKKALSHSLVLLPVVEDGPHGANGEIRKMEKHARNSVTGFLSGEPFEQWKQPIRMVRNSP